MRGYPTEVLVGNANASGTAVVVDDEEDIFEEYYDEFKRVFPDLYQKDECFINKPIGMNDLIRTIKSHLN
jgi:hypothetical protein